jgi:hypothetical protein
MRASVCLLLVLSAFACAGCGPYVDLTTGLQVEIVSTGWFDVGVVNGQNKLVPSVSFRLKNVSDQKLSALQVTARFSRASETDEWGNDFVIAGELKPGATTATLTLKSRTGYTGSGESRAEMLQNTRFVDAKVLLSAKYSSSEYQHVGEYPIARQLVTK